MRVFRRKRAIITLSSLLLTACASYPVAPQPVSHSLYLNKKYLRFILDHGEGYRTVRLKNGNRLHYWRSDEGGLIAIATGRDDHYPDYCEIALETDPKQIVRRIYIIEPSSICNAVLK
jgi:hypothetical protein